MATRGNISVYTTDLFEFEEKFDQEEYHSHLVKNWTNTFWYCLVYVILVFGGRRYMSTRPRFELRLPLIVWSSGLAAFSIFGALRTIPELVFMLKNHGIEGSVCDPSYFYGPTAFWAALFTSSKLYELGDTAFIVLRKQPLIFLHWYHHVTVFLYVQYSFTDHTAPGRWFMVMNYTVHSFMYSYYALRAMKFRLPKFISMFITSLQIMQMLTGVIVIFVANYAKQQGHFCQQSRENMRYCAIMYTSYLLLFSHFFYNAYLKPKSSTDKPTTAPVNGQANGKIMNGNHVNGTAK